MGFFLLALVLFWMKTYIIYISEFNLGVTNLLQHFLLFINPLSSGLILLGLALFFKGKRFGIALLIIDSLLTLFMYANIVFYREYSSFITIQTLMQTDNAGSIGKSFLGLAEWYDVFYALDLIILAVLFFKRKAVWSPARLSFKKPFAVLATGVLVFAGNLGLAEIDRPQLLERVFDNNYIVKYLGAPNFAVFNTVQSVKANAKRSMASSEDVTEVENYTDKKYAEPNEKYFGKAEGKNIIKIHLESFQSFLIDYKLHGEEVTPFLNSLVHDDSKNFTYFDNFFHQTEQGKTADAELLLDTSLYGLPQGSAFVTKGSNTYQALPAILDQKQDYTSAVFHGDEGSFWNRDKVYKQLGIDKFYESSYYDMSEDKVINYGLKDKPFFKQSMPMLEDLAQKDEPFYAHMMTLTHHYPFVLDEGEASIEPAETGDGTVDRYFQTARYLDEALKQFFDDLKEKGLYEDSVIMIYGDHNGISENHNRAMSEITGEEITPLKNANLQRVPYMIRVPGMEGQGTNHEYSGMTDVVPTMLHLLGIDSKKYIQFGTDMFSDEHKDFVPFRNGSFMTEEYSYVQEVFYDNDTGEPIEEPTKEMKEKRDQVLYELSLNDEVLNGDLLRFYEPSEDWEPVDPNEYQYGKDNEESTEEKNTEKESTEDNNKEEAEDTDNNDENNS
ncbi:LTA synthase family protein [Lentibacillus amyloliquefaciens]|uniref:Glycerol phosphate lipoteichoic acid synthase n=1 Tax=Lentibacillus amyloliquefaciens TaxID=1472767 RepID=A0A0U4F532_9BACI|nr:glycerol phosphate lipoteichoic acid synthase [Lentibacillus amyloliquefaciens]